jgi:hypothetical protein
LGAALIGFLVVSASGESHELIQDTAFQEGFGASWYYGSKFSGDRHREGRVLAYRKIPLPDMVKLIPEGRVGGLGAREHPWDFEEGQHLNYTNETGQVIKELHRHRFVVNHWLEANSPDKLQFAQFNNEGLAPSNPAWNKRLVKRITSDRHGAIRVYYNSKNDIRNAATRQSAQWAHDTWPHLLLNQTFKDLPRLRDYQRLDLGLSYTVTRLSRLSNWPSAGASMNLKFMFFLREIKDPDKKLFVGMMLQTSNPKLYAPFTGIDQFGTVFYRDSITQYGPVPRLNESRTVQREIKSLVREALVKAREKQPELSGDPDDYYLFNFAIGWEGLGHWEAECELRGLSLKGSVRNPVAADSEAAPVTDNAHRSKVSLSLPPET